MAFGCCKFLLVVAGLLSVIDCAVSNGKVRDGVKSESIDSNHLADRMRIRGGRIIEPTQDFTLNAIFGSSNSEVGDEGWSLQPGYETNKIEDDEERADAIMVNHTSPGYAGIINDNPGVKEEDHRDAATEPEITQVHAGTESTTEVEPAEVLENDLVPADVEEDGNVVPDEPRRPIETENHLEEADERLQEDRSDNPSIHSMKIVVSDSQPTQHRPDALQDEIPETWEADDFRQTPELHEDADPRALTLSAPLYEQQVLFPSRLGNYSIFRNPAIIRTSTGILLAFAEGRRYSRRNYGDIDIVVKRSLNNGTSWSALKVVVEGGGDTAGHPAPVVDARSGLITLIYCRNGGADSEQEIRVGYARHRTIWKVHSYDDGTTWGKELQISRKVRRWYWTWYATGPGHGIQLASGRLIIPCQHGIRRFVGFLPWDRPEYPDRSHVIYSDNYGLDWRLGGSSAGGTGQATAVETPNGMLYLNSQTKTNATVRYVAWSTDSGKTFSRGRLEPTLIEPFNVGAHGSLQRVLLYGIWPVLLFSNPASYDGTRMTISLSVDSGDSWIRLKTIYEGRSGSSDMINAVDESVNLVYENEDEIALARFNLPWLFLGL